MRVKFLKSPTLLLGALWCLPAKFSILLLRLWHLVSQPLLGEQCRFVPSCSVYAKEAIEQYGFIKGWFKGIGRVCRCHPFSKGGFDPLSENKEE